ncbi:5-amino-6-(5-phospho-D-ribitylamino)uracil phosphatase YigB [Vibrio sp. CAU 1672]|uniref:5-amino-6-(5-phospho-D-ribitylamino)uracil phosphatase YigB n=1 Tax=Vibrio sp. CAU 1672 TaxID=3032594 RepID=UPI0023DBC42F|nr:5-amino-6-(5-phospho-D-ribitylamino)uracil phosphatase YigB [Vibrio sp. CAU 1672]MDF2155908.1 5-amino-6-(5-phospho-D-ribitylamino)uracil phosphatase YigB [Vibrio sp. CAU 1672]
MKFYRRIAPVKAMTFDLDDTLYDNAPVIQRMEQQLLAWLQSYHPATRSLERTQWLALKKQVVRRDPQLRHDVTRWRLEQLREGFCLCGYPQAQALQAAQQGVDIALYWRSQIEVPAATHQILTQLAQHIPLVAITNGNVDLARIGLADYFTACYQAGPDGQAKPARDLFDLAHNQLILPRANILHVGDHLTSDIEGAKRAGFAACWLNDMNKNVIKQSEIRTLPDVEISELAWLNTLL